MSKPTRKRQVSKRAKPSTAESREALVGRERYVHNIINGGDRTLRRVPSLELFTGKDWAEAIADADERLRAFNSAGAKTPLEIVKGRLKDQKTRWGGLKGAVHFDVVLLDEPTLRVKPHRIGLIALAHMDNDKLHTFGLVTEIAYRNPSVETDLMPRGTDVSPDLAYLANSIVHGREISARVARYARPAPATI